jgi:hypothetical protein
MNILEIVFFSTQTRVQLAKKERTYEPNSKFDKTYKNFLKVLPQYICRN